MTGLNEALNEAAAIIKASIGRMMNEEEKLLSWEWRSVKGAGNTEFPFLSLALSLALFFLTHTFTKGPQSKWCLRHKAKQMFELITVTIIIYTITSVTSNAV